MRNEKPWRPAIDVCKELLVRCLKERVQMQRSIARLEAELERLRRLK